VDQLADEGDVVLRELLQALEVLADAARDEANQLVVVFGGLDVLLDDQRVVDRVRQRLPQGLLRYVARGRELQVRPGILVGLEGKSRRRRRRRRRRSRSQRVRATLVSIES